MVFRALTSFYARFPDFMTADAHTFQIVHDPQLPPAGLQGAVYALGNFDGVHRGHKAVIGEAMALARRLGKPCAVLTFEPHPADFFAGKRVVERITPPQAHARALERLGVDGVVILSFNADIANITAETFVGDILAKRLGASGMVAGYDYHFGKGREGTPEALKAIGQRNGLAVDIVGKVAADANGSLDAVHSSAVRKALAEGDMALTSRLLGHDFFVVGEVIHGQALGRTLGFPTANLELDPSMHVAHGIYAVRFTVDGRTYNGVASYGRRPTLDNGAPLLEVFVFDFSDDLYGKTVEVTFVAWLRPELKFDGLDPLMVQMRKDEAEARAILRNS